MVLDSIALERGVSSVYTTKSLPNCSESEDYLTSANEIDFGYNTKQ